MKDVKNYNLDADEASIWFLGQAGYLIKSNNRIVAIDPYLSNSVAKIAPELTRAVEVPFEPSQLDVDIYIVTHDHLDHLDPETIEAYRYKNKTTFVAPRLAVKKLISLGVPAENIVQIDAGQAKKIKDVEISSIYAIPNEPDVIDTCGYKLEFKNGRSVYHSSDTGFSDLLLDCVPKTEVALLCINGKWGNMGPKEAADVAVRVNPQTAIPNHYDVMSLNSENPQTFKFLVEQKSNSIDVKILEIMKPFVWK